MSADSATGRLRSTVGRMWSPRTLALVGAVGLLFSFLSVLYQMITVTGDPDIFLVLVAVSLAAAAALSRLLRPLAVAVIAAVVLAVGMAIYVVSLPNDPAVVALLASNLELLTGRSLLRIERTTVWAMSVTPTPVFVTAYLALRREYTAAAAVGGITLGYFVLTGDATTTLTLLGVVSAAALIGFGDLDSEDGQRSRGAVQAVTVVLALMVLAPAAIPAVPASSGSPLSLTGGGQTVEASLLSTDAQFDIEGSITLSPEVRYTVTSATGSYWRVGSYDRYTGDGWVRTGENSPYRDGLSGPPGPSVTVTQRYEIESATDVMPAAWRPVGVDESVASRTAVTAAGGLIPTEEFETGDSYRVTSQLPQATPTRLAEAGTDYPDRVEEKYTQLPANVPNRVRERTTRLTGRAENPYETARVIEQWLEENRAYSLEVDQPSGNVADAFLFEMDRGYCTYYATTMATMLRTQGIPARVAVGYTAGQQVDEETWVVRGLDSHTWVEVYFPETGWVRFDPTPAGPRRQAEQERLEQARQENTSNVDTSGSEPTPTPTSTPTPNGTIDTPPGANTSETENATPSVTVAGNIRGEGGSGNGPGGFELPDLPSREQALLGAVVFAGAVAGLRRSGLNRRLSWWLRGRLGPPDDPDAAVEWIFDRLAFRLEQRHRPRRRGETVRAYLNAIDADDRARRIAVIRERARYGGGATEDMAEEAARLFAALRRESD